jgi:hypothetical protein
VVKIIPMGGDVWVNNAPQKGAGDLAAEAVIALALSRLRDEYGPDGAEDLFFFGGGGFGMIGG